MKLDFMEDVIPFNCTIEELKCSDPFVYVPVGFAFNCTIEELKFFVEDGIFFLVYAFNCTIEELK